MTESDREAQRDMCRRNEESVIQSLRSVGQVPTAAYSPTHLVYMLDTG